MQRTSRRTRSVVTGLVLAALAAATLAMVSSDTVGAQPGADASAELRMPPPDPGRQHATLALAFDPGDADIAALSATVRLDPTAVSVLSCAVAEAGACNVDGGEVLFSVFNTRRLGANPQLFTVDVELPADGTHTTFEASVDAVTSGGTAAPVISVAPLSVSSDSTEVGSLTGDVVALGSTSGLFDLEVCANDEGVPAACTTTGGLGTWRIDDLPEGRYTIQVEDPAGVYGSASVSADVRADQTLTIEPVELDLATAIAGEPNDPTELTATGSAAGQATEPTATDPTPPPTPTPDPVRYEASIVGRVVAPGTNAPLEGVQVCATQPLVLRQSCASTMADGTFTLADLSTGNYWVQAVDPLGRFAESAPVLVGVVGDQATRSGVEILLDAASS